MNDRPLTTASLLLERADDDHAALLFEDSRWTWRQFVAESSTRARLLHELRDGDRPFHIGVMLENDPEYLFLIGGAALAGATVVGVNLTRRGGELAEDIRFTDCRIIVTDSASAGRLDGLDLGIDHSRVLVLDSPEYKTMLEEAATRSAPALPTPAAQDPATRLLLLFTSGSTGRPKAVICSTGRLAAIASRRHMDIGRDDVSYSSMPLFHGNAIMACWASTLATGGTFALARRFSASRFVPDLIKFGATYFTYVGRALAYVLARPESADEKATKLRCAFGTEASSVDRHEFHRRFGIMPTESFGSSEGGLSIVRTDDTPEDALGRPQPGLDAVVLDPSTLQECPRARFDASGRLTNAGEAIGELANLTGARLFEGYYKNPGAEAERVRGDIFLTGDLGYRDAEGFFYFAGRSGDKLRVDSENFSSAPIERILTRYPGVRLAAVYAAPDERTGDQVMATLQFPDADDFDAQAFAEFLARQPDLGTKWSPRYVRIVTDVPITATRKIDKARLRTELWMVDDPIFLRPGCSEEYRPMTDRDRGEIRRGFERNKRHALLPAPPASDDFPARRD
ncbi:AMP-binding protein [Tomitella fengzijianii]|uniref:AMP-binding protein n=1 Tax=Tomitella fengzijianii TaxID=2597660 RepID=A0A516X6W3_9ACTN|nr:AMP-binding protein [Tomitella fengzijianii]QDQ98809.1 AMP-binding protein [Tomitella fengzijianii]